MHFGYNCKYFLPWFNKCKFLIDHKALREEFCADKWLSLKDALIYTSLLGQDLMALVNDHKVKIEKVKIKKGMDKKEEQRQQVRVAFFTAWAYDECPLAEAGGQCLFFKQHTGPLIDNLSEMQAILQKHPNWPNLPEPQEVEPARNIAGTARDATKKGQPFYLRMNEP